MAGLVKKFLASASVVGMSAVFGAPAMAGGFTVTGTAGTQYFLYEQVGNQTVRNDDAKLKKILRGDSSSPGGNIELGILDDGTNPIVELSVENNDGDTAIFRNMTDSDWGAVQINGKTVGQNWFAGVWAQALGNMLDSQNYNFLIDTADSYANDNKDTYFGGNYDYAFNYNLDYNVNYYANNGYASWESAKQSNMYDMFVKEVGFGMIGDPNISYINKAGDDVKVGLAGHFNLADRFKGTALEFMLEGVQASEVFAYEIDGATGYGWSYKATDSKLTEAIDGISHNGNYEVTIGGAGGILPEDVPEPSTVLGLMAIGGLVTATKRKSAK